MCPQDCGSPGAAGCIHCRRPGLWNSGRPALGHRAFCHFCWWYIHGTQEAEKVSDVIPERCRCEGQNGTETSQTLVSTQEVSPYRIYSTTSCFFFFCTSKHNFYYLHLTLFNTINRGGEQADFTLMWTPCKQYRSPQMQRFPGIFRFGESDISM